MKASIIHSLIGPWPRCQYSSLRTASRSRLLHSTLVRSAERASSDASSPPFKVEQTTQSTSLPSTSSEPTSSETSPSATPDTTAADLKPTPLPSSPSSSPPTAAEQLSSTIMGSASTSYSPPSSSISPLLSSLSSSPSSSTSSHRPPPHRLLIYSHKHNTHITLSRPSTGSSPSNLSPGTTPYSSLLSLSTGQIGFKKAARGSYDAAYQLGAYVMNLIKDKGYLRDMREVEVVMRDFGKGREALTKILCGQEGRSVRGRVVKVMDATRTKFGGTRSRKVRRLG